MSSSRLIPLQVGELRAGFSEQGALLSLEPSFRRQPVLRRGPESDLSPFRILRRPLNSRTGGTQYTSRDFTIRLAGQSSERLVFEGVAHDGSLTMVMLAKASLPGGIELGLELTNRRGAPVWLVAFPVLEGVSWGPGQRVTVPMNSGFSLDPRRLDDGEEILLNYPVHASMQWLDLYTHRTGLYFGVHDDLPYVKQCTIAKKGESIRMEWRYPDVALTRGQTWTLPPAIIDLHRGDWHAGADRYRRWAERWIRFPEPPPWFSRLPAWSWLTGKGNRAPTPERRFADLPATVSLLRKETGTPVVQLAGWMEHGHDTHYPDYVAGECMGGRSGLIRALRQIHRSRGRLALYTNGRLIDPEGDVGSMPGWRQSCVRLAPCSRENAGIFTGTFARRTAWDPAGDVAQEKYGRTVFAVACPHSRAWQNLFTDRILGVVRTYPVDGLYIDQVCGATALPCYAGDHGHERPNLAWRGYRELLGTLRSAVKRIRPGLYLSTEGVSDVFGCFFDAQQSHNDWTAQIHGKGEDLAELFRYTFPESLFLVGPTSPGDRAYLRLGFAIAAGFDCFPILPDRSDPDFRGFMRSTLGLRRVLSPFLRGTRPLAEVSARGCPLRVFGLEGPEHVLITGAWAGETRPKRCRIRFRPRSGSGFRQAELWTPSRRSLRWKEEEGTITFEAPKCEIFAGLFRR